MDCFGTYLTHAQTCVDIPVQSAAGWTAWQWRFARRNENVADVTAQTLLKLTWWKNKDAAAKCILVRKQSGFFINICSSYFQILFPWHDVLSTNTRRKQKMICARARPASASSKKPLFYHNGTSFGLSTTLKKCCGFWRFLQNRI